MLTPRYILSSFAVRIIIRIDLLSQRRIFGNKISKNDLYHSSSNELFNGFPDIVSANVYRVEL